MNNFNLYSKLSEISQCLPITFVSFIIQILLNDPSESYIFYMCIGFMLTHTFYAILEKRNRCARKDNH